MKEIHYYSTRNSGRDNSTGITSKRAIYQGLSEDGGLFVPDAIPELPMELAGLAGMSYREVAMPILGAFLTDFTEEELRYCVDHAYDEKFDSGEIVPIKEAGGAFFLELFHGRTLAFKDMALSILPYFMLTSRQASGSDKEIVILTATSGDTGKAALAGFADVEGTRIMVFYPRDGVSRVQKLQMVTQKGGNVSVVGVKGNFDDCQNAVKRMFGDRELNKRLNDHGHSFSSANSINIGRLVPQIVYYVYGYGQLLKRGVIKAGDEVNITVPTGNFGNILAAYYAREMGLPVHRLICASNENKVLFDFFRDGKYDRERPFILTSSPSMDILISSNLERLIYHASGNDPELTGALMGELKDKGNYSISPEMREKIGMFKGYYASEKDTLAAIGSLYRESGYVIDTHTAVAYHAYTEYRKETGDSRPTLIASTASPFKFVHSVMEAIDPERASGDELELSDRLSFLAGVPLPEAVKELRIAPVLHNGEAELNGMQEAVENFLGL